MKRLSKEDEARIRRRVELQGSAGLASTCGRHRRALLDELDAVRAELAEAEAELAMAKETIAMSTTLLHGTEKSCEQCGKPCKEWQRYCGAACCAQAEAHGKKGEG